MKSVQYHSLHRQNKYAKCEPNYSLLAKKTILPIMVYFALILICKILHYILKCCIKVSIMKTTCLAPPWFCAYIPHLILDGDLIMAMTLQFWNHQLRHLKSCHWHFIYPDFPCYSFLLWTILFLPPILSLYRLFCD